MLFHCKKRLINFIFEFIIIFLIFSFIHSEERKEKKIIYENDNITQILQVAIPITAIGGVFFVISDEEMRNYFKDRWIRFTSPNHASEDQQTSFHFRTLEEDINQSTQCDRGVHFIFSYIPVIPLAILMDKSYSAFAKGRIERKLSNWSVITSASIIGALAIFEEYTDGHQINEGFDFIDLTANFSGITMALLEHYNILNGVDFYWSFNYDMYKNSSEYGKWPWWTYMQGYEFAININILYLLTKNHKANKIYNLIIKTPAYIPDMDKLFEYPDN